MVELAALSLGLSACGGLVDGSPNVSDAAQHPTADARVRVDVATHAPPQTDASTSRDADAADAPRQDVAIDSATPDVGPPLGVLPSTAMCLTGGNVLWVVGGPDNFWFTGTQLDSAGSEWEAEALSYYAAPYDGVIVGLRPAGQPPLGTHWTFSFNSWPTKTALAVGQTYDSSQFYGGGSVSYLAACSQVIGSFRVDAFSAGPADGGIGAVTEFTAAFSFGCDGTTGVLSGCVHYASE